MRSNQGSSFLSKVGTVYRFSLQLDQDPVFLDNRIRVFLKYISISKIRFNAIHIRGSQLESTHPLRVFSLYKTNNECFTPPPSQGYFFDTMLTLFQARRN